MYNYPLNYVSNHLKINLAKKNMVFKIIYSRRILQILKIIKNLGVIRKFLLIKQTNKLNKFSYFKVYTFYYKNIPTYNYFKTISTPSKKFFISLKALNHLKLCTGDSTFLLETDNGIITHYEAIKLKKGGKLFAFLTF